MPVHRRTRPTALALAAIALAAPVRSQDTRLLRQPTLSAEHVAFTYASDVWVVERAGGTARRITSTPATESDPHLSPDGRWVAFSSDRSGTPSVYVVAVEGGEPTRLTWYPAAAYARGWTPDGRGVLYASTRETAPVPHERLWTVAREGGPSTVVPAPWGHSGSYAPDGRRIVVDRMGRWDVEWRGYRGGQNTPLVVLDLASLEEVRLPNERTTDTQPLWLGERIYFLSDRDFVTNIWSYDPASGALSRVTRFQEGDVKALGGREGTLVFERQGWIHTLDTATVETERLRIHVAGDFPWVAASWRDVGESATSASLSATGKRALFEARGEIFTVPVEHGDARNLTRSQGVADRAPVWAPDGARVAWFSESDGVYVLRIGEQDGLTAPRTLSIGESKMAWSPVWSPDGRRIAFSDDRSLVRVLDLESGRIRTIDADGSTFGRGGMGLQWSPDSKWLAYSKIHSNQLRRIVVWSVEDDVARTVTDPLADATSPAWDRDGRHLYFLASTDVGLGAGWANTSSMESDPTYGAYVVVLRAEDPSPFPPRSDEESAKDTSSASAGEPEDDAKEETPDAGGADVVIDFEGIGNRILALPMPQRRYGELLAGPKGTVFVGERVENEPGVVVHKFSLEERKADVFTRGVSQLAVSADGAKLLYRSGQQWSVVDAARPPEPGKGWLTMELRAHVDPMAEWAQMFEEAWRQERDYFYDPGLHGADWDAVHARYAPLLPYVRHRSDLNYLLDQVNGELAVGHSFVFGGDMPDTDTSRVGLLGADLEAADGRWRIARIYTAESWNPSLDAPLARPGVLAETGDYLLAVNGVELTADDDPYRLLDGTAGRQTVVHLNDLPTMDGARTATVVPVRSEYGLRQRAWVEDNRRRVDELSGGRLAYVWVPNTGGPGVVSFDRYFFSQQDKEGAVIDERFNGGGLLDDYMVDLMTRDLRAAVTNEAPGGRPMRLPAGILGPKVLLINELAGSGGDFFPWVFRQQGAGPLIGTRTWGGLVASCSHYPLMDGGRVTAPCAAVFEPGVGWIAENEGVPPDIEVLMDARSVAEGRDPQLERGVREALRLLEERPTPEVVVPPFSRPVRR